VSTREPELPRFGKSTLIPKPIKAKINRAYETIHNLGAEIGRPGSELEMDMEPNPIRFSM
jgi:hypothetical protein